MFSIIFILASLTSSFVKGSGNLSPDEWKDFSDRHGDWIEKEYPGGLAKFDPERSWHHGLGAFPKGRRNLTMHCFPIGVK